MNFVVFLVAPGTFLLESGCKYKKPLSDDTAQSSTTSKAVNMGETNCNNNAKWSNFTSVYE